MTEAKARVRDVRLDLIEEEALRSSNVGTMLQVEAADPKCGFFSERQFDTADGHITRYRDTCEHVVCYGQQRVFAMHSSTNWTYDAQTASLSCVREP